MSDAVFPDLPGLTWSVFKAPEFNTKLQTSVNLTELRASFSATPVYKFRLSYDLLRDNAVDELRELGGFFLSRQGRFDSWLFSDPTDCNASAQLFGTGDGVTANFQLVRTFGAFTEKVSNLGNVSQVTVSNTPTSNYTVSNTGLVMFAAAPAANAPLHWTGNYYFRARFEEDVQEFENFMYQLWSAQSVAFRANLGTKLA